MFKLLLMTSLMIVAPGTAYSHGAGHGDGASKLSSTPHIPGMRTVRALSGDKSLVTQAGQDIHVYSFEYKDSTGQPSKAKHRFLIQGGLHGNELLTTEFVTWLARRYARGQSPLNNLSDDQVAFDFVPKSNPDGLQTESRYNAKGVNLNRNFGTLWGISKENPGDHEFSEPETRSIKFLFEKNQYTAAVDVHGYINWIVAPTSPEILKKMGVKVPHDRAAKYYQWDKALKKEMRMLPGYSYKTAGGLGDGGAFEDWAFWGAGSFSYCLELKSPERFATSYRRPFGNIAQAESKFQIDMFKRYEAHISRMFNHAIAIKGNVLPGQLAESDVEIKPGSKGTH
jgi:hypothetical protein